MSHSSRSWGAFSAFALAWNNSGSEPRQHPFFRQGGSGFPMWPSMPSGRSWGAQRTQHATTPQPGPKKNVVIVGGGFAGGSTAMQLQDHFNVTLVDKRPYFENVTAHYRVLSDGNMVARNRLDHSNYAPSVDVQVGSVERISQDHVLLEDNTVLPFDYLVIASGSHYRSLPVLGSSGTPPIPVVSLTDGVACEMEQQRLASTNGGAVAVAGGGASGVEVAAELAEAYPGKTVHLITSGHAPLANMSKEAQAEVERHFSTLKNLHMWPHERVVGIDSDDGSVITKTGKKITGLSSVFLCVGFQPNTEFVKEDMSHLLDNRGFVKVNQHLQSTEQSNVFAVGDVTNIQESKLAQNAFRHAAVAARNIITLESSRNLTTTLRTYTPAERKVCIMLGRSNSVVVGPTGVESGLQWAKRKQGFALSANVLPFSARMFSSRM